MIVNDLAATASPSAVAAPYRASGAPAKHQLSRSRRERVSMSGKSNFLDHQW